LKEILESQQTFFHSRVITLEGDGHRSAVELLKADHRVELGTDPKHTGMVLSVDGIDMARVKTSVVINRPVEEVFEVVTNFEKNAQWQPGCLGAKQTSEGPIGIGTTFTDGSQFLGLRIEETGEVTAYELNRKFGARTTSGPIPVKGEYTFNSVENGTRITVDAEAELGGFFKSWPSQSLTAHSRDKEKVISLTLRTYWKHRLKLISDGLHCSPRCTSWLDKLIARNHPGLAPQTGG